MRQCEEIKMKESRWSRHPPLKHIKYIKEMLNFVVSKIHSGELFSLKDFHYKILEKGERERELHIYEHKSKIYRKRFFMAATIIIRIEREGGKVFDPRHESFIFYSLFLLLFCMNYDCIKII